MNICLETTPALFYTRHNKNQNRILFKKSIFLFFLPGSQCHALFSVHGIGGHLCRVSQMPKNININ